MTPTAYARHRKEAGLPGRDPKAVRVAIESGRLPRECLTPDRKRILDAAAADAAWAATTRADYVPLTGPTAPNGATVVSMDYAEARRRREAAEAEKAEIELAELKQTLIPAADVEARLVGVFSRCKTKLLGVPSRARQQDPGLTTAQIALVDALIREGLEDLAGGE